LFFWKSVTFFIAYVLLNLISENFFIFREKERDRRKRDDDRPAPSVAAPKPVKGLSESQRDRFEDMLRTLLPDRNPIAETMVRNK
jgi:hypothetical protein